MRGPSDIRQLLHVPALASIPVIITEETRARRRKIARYSWGGGAVAVILLATLVHVLVLPLDVLWLSLLRRFGV